MSLFQCEKCGCVDNTALSYQGFSFVDLWDWNGLEQWKGKMLCIVCGPSTFNDGSIPSRRPIGVWHGRFDRIFLPKGMFRTNGVGNLEHIETGETDYRKYAVDEE